MSNFDDIMKEGKRRATKQTINSPQYEFRRLVRQMMESLHELNAFYGESDKHFINIEPKACKSCKKASYAIITKNIKNTGQKTRYYRSGWSKEGTGYVCKQCRGGK